MTSFYGLTFPLLLLGAGWNGNKVKTFRMKIRSKYLKGRKWAVANSFCDSPFIYHYLYNIILNYTH
jgi:hypothetical protein